MNDADRASLETRVLLLAPTVKDGELTRAILARSGIACVGCPDQSQMGLQLTAGAGAVLIAEEAIHGGNSRLADWLVRQPPWSDLPVLVLARVGADSPAITRAMAAFGNVTVLERPTRVAALISAVRTALRARQRQYQLRDQLLQRERAADHLSMAMAAAEAGSWQVNMTTGEFSASARATELHGLPPAIQLNHERALACVHPDDRASIAVALQRTFETGKPFTHEHRVLRPDGSVRWVLSQAQRQGEGDQTCVVGLVQDITKRRLAESLQSGQRQVLELVARDARLPDVLAAVCQLIEDQEPGLFCTLLLADAQGRHTGLAVGASLPAAVLRGLEGLRLDPPYIGACGEALDRGEVIVVADVEADERFAPGWRALLLGHGLRACRSSPVLGLKGKVLASFALYRQQPGDPEPANNQLVQVATSLTAIAIQRHLAQESLRTSEERFRTLFDSMDEGFCVVEMVFDEGGRASDYSVMEMNPAFEKHTGMGGLVGKSVRQAIPELEEFWYETYGRVAATGEPTRFVHSAGPMDGRWFDVYAFRLGAAGSNKVAILFNDITASRNAQEAVKASEARSSFLVALTDALRPLSDPTAVQAEASRVLGERLGANRVVFFEVRDDDALVEADYTDAAGSIVGRYPLASFGETLLAALRAGRTTNAADVDALASLTTEEKGAFASVETRSYIAVPLVKDGTFVAGLAVNSTRPRAWTPTEIAMTEDAAERTWTALARVRAEAALRASEEQRRLALDAAELGTWHVDIATRLTKTDARFRAIFGTTEEWTDYRQLLAAIHPDDLPAVERAVASAIRPDDPVPSAIEYRVVHPDGAVRWVFGKGATTHEEHSGKKAMSFNGTVMDITARKLVEQERERLVIQLRDADRLKDEFLATLAHELRNPLAPLRNGLQMIRLARADGTVERARSMMDRQLTQLVRLVDDLMDVSRVTSGKLELRKARVELRALIDAAVETSLPVIEQAGHELTVVVPDEPIVVEADAARLSQVVSNLLINSAKYTHQGGHIRLAAWREDGTAVVSVKDDGIGIPPAMLGRVFEMFTQVDRALEKTTGGLGIGLSLVKGLLEMHGGTIEARSDGEGAGSEFVVRMPLAMDVIVGVEDPNEQTRVNAPGALRRILVVDDNVDAADSMAQLLGMLGNEVRTANDGEAGIALAAQFRPDVVLMDIGMPKLNGYESARRIRLQPWGRSMMLVALTGWGQEGDREKSADAGFDRHLVKPLGMDVLTKLMSSLDSPAGAIKAAPSHRPSAVGTTPQMHPPVESFRRHRSP